jgi:hypothetical protein
MAEEMVDASNDGMESVVKIFKPPMTNDRRVYFDETMTQSVAETYAQDFNRLASQKGLKVSVAFLPVSVLHFYNDGHPSTESGQLACLEPYLPGDYVKHNDNGGNIGTSDPTAQAFSYFSYIQSNKLLVVCDIQGVGDFYTDPQIHTMDGSGFGMGNLGQRGIDCFLRTFRYSSNAVVQQLGLPSPFVGMTDQEMAARLQAEEDDRSRRAGGGVEAMMQAMVGGGGVVRGGGVPFNQRAGMEGHQRQWTAQRYDGQMDQGMQLLQQMMGGGIDRVPGGRRQHVARMA